MKSIIRYVVAFLSGCFIGMVGVRVYCKKKSVGKNEGNNKFKTYYHTTNQWLKLVHQNKCIKEWFQQNNYHTVGIYGFGELGKRLFEELEDTDIKVKYAIDQAIDTTDYNIKIYRSEDIFDDVDVVVVTAVFAYDEVKTMLDNKIYCPIVSLQDIVYEC